MSRRAVAAYFVVAASILAALFITLGLERLDNKPTLFLFLGSVVISTTYGGLGPGLVCLGVSAVISAIFIFPPLHHLEIDEYGSLLRWLTFQGVGLMIVLIQVSRRNAAQRFSESDNRLRLAMDAGRIGVFDHDVDTGMFYLSDGLAALFGQPRKHFATSFEQFLTFIHPDDRNFFQKAITRTIEDRVDYEIDFRVIRPDNSERWLVTRGRGYIAEGSNTRRVVGVISENTSDVSRLAAIKGGSTYSTAV